MEWDTLSGALGAILWILFLAARKRKQRGARGVERPARDRGRREPPHGQTPADEFRRDYEPIEPKWR